MCAPFEDSEVGNEIKIFKDKVKHNGFYQYCAEKLGKETDGKYSKDQMKKMIFSVIFSSNEERKKHIVVNKEMFRQVFPFISSVLEGWKAEIGNNLAKVLQRIESYLFLECICTRIKEERPDLPIFTIHDSIVTLESEASYVKWTMYDEIQQRTNFNPHFEVEAWKVENFR